MASHQNATVDEADWARAIHAVKVQKVSLRNAAQLYGVHHMALHRRVRGRYAASAATSFDIRSFLSEADEAEVVNVLREQFLHEHRITSDDIRFVVRAVASHGGERAVPPEFPPSRWVVTFKRAYGFMAPNRFAYSSSEAAMNSDDDGASSSDSSDHDDSYGQRPPLLPPRYAQPAYPNSHVRAETERKDEDVEGVDDDDDRHHHYQRSDLDRDHVESCSNRFSFAASGATATTTSSTCGSVATSEQSCVTAVAGMSSAVSTASSSSATQGLDSQHQRTYKLSHTVSPETWEKAIAAVEQQGMSLRAAARAYGVHFAALHRRVKKRAQGDAAAPIDGYFHPDDEAGIIRVVVARAELGVLMTFDELMDLVQRAALHNLPDISVDAARKLLARFQARNEHSTRHIVVDWPLPRMSSISRASTSSSSTRAPGSASTVRVVHTSSRPSVIVTNTSSSSSDASVARAAASLSALGVAAPPPPPPLPVRALASSLGVRHASASAQPRAAPAHTALTVRVPPAPPLPPSSAKRSSKLSSRTFV